MKFVVIRDRAAGNESVGEMWQETKIFDGGATLNEVMLWAEGIADFDYSDYSRGRITITRPHQEKETP